MRFSGLRIQEINPLTFLAPLGQKYNIVRENISLSYVVITHKRAKKKFGKTLQESFQSFTFVRYYKKFVMGCIFVIRGILIYIYAFDHNPPHIHVRSGTDNFSITIEDRIIEGIARTTTITIINKFIDDKKDELLEIWDKAQKGEKINKIR